MSRRFYRWWVVMGCALLSCACSTSAAHSRELPEARVFEQVSPAFKAGYPVTAEQEQVTDLSTDGNAVKFVSVGAFNGSGENFALNPYVTRRSADRWTTSGLFPSAAGGTCATGLEVISADLSSFEFILNEGSIYLECERSPSLRVVVHEASGERFLSPWLTTQGSVPAGLTMLGGSTTLGLMVGERRDEPADHFWAEDETVTGSQLLEFEGASTRPRLVAVDNAGNELTRYCDVRLGGEDGAFGAISQPEAGEVFFSFPYGTQTSITNKCETGVGHPNVLYARVRGVETIDVSAPSAIDCSEDPCLSASLDPPLESVYQGAAEDGSMVVFTTSQPLVNEDKDAGNDLYVARIGCAGGLQGEACGSSQRQVESVSLVSADPHAGQAADVAEHVLAVSPDGSHVYFVAGGVLSENANAEVEKAALGAENLYVSSESEGGARTVSFVADLCSGPEQSGAALDQRCPAGIPAGGDHRLWSKAERRQAQTTPDGRFLLFSTYARLIGGGGEADTDAVRDVYRYDSATGTMLRVSVGEAGADRNGNDSSYEAAISGTTFNGSPQTQNELGNRAIADDGSLVAFVSGGPLANGAINGLANVYLWSASGTRMLSAGTAVQPDEEPIVSSTGRDVLFATSAGLVPTDTDGLRDLYDARVEGGFPVEGTPVKQCAADACPGPFSQPTPVIVPATAVQQPGGNLPSPKAVKKPKIVKKKPKRLKGKKARHARVRKFAAKGGRR